MSAVDNLLPGSYKSIPFLSTGSTSTSVIKDIKHQFPNSDRQSIEYLGTDPQSYSIKMVISGENYLANSRAMIAALEDAGMPGKLTHPLYGDISNIVCRSWDISEALATVGKTNINATFEVSEGSGIPETTGTNVASIIAQSSTVTSGISANVSDNYTVTDSFTNSFNDSVNKLDAVAGTFNSGTKVLQASADKIDAYSQQISDFSKDIANLVKSPQALADSIDSLFISISGLYPTTEATFTVFTGFFNFGDLDIALTTSTASKIERDRNNRLINGTLQGQALSNAYVAASKIEFTTVEDIDAVLLILENQYEKINALDQITHDSKNDLTDLRIIVQSFLDNEKINSKQVIEVDTPETSSSLLAYQYYGSSDLSNTLADINRPLDSSFLKGKVKVLTA